MPFPVERFYEHTNYIAGITFDGARWTRQPAAQRSIGSGLAVSSRELRPAKWTATETNAGGDYRGRECRRRTMPRERRW